MIISTQLLNKIQKIIDKHYNYLTVSLLGNSVFTPEELNNLKRMGIDTTNKESFLKSIYVHNLINNVENKTIPTTIKEMLKQQKDNILLTNTEAYAVSQLNNTFKVLLDKLKQDTITNMSNVILNEGVKHKFEVIGNPNRTPEEKEEMEDLTFSKIKSELLDSSGEVGRNFDRIVSTEMSNALGNGSIDRIVKDNKDKDFNDVYVYRISVMDGKLCPACRRLYVDSDGTPKVYRLSTLLSNGTNYGKKFSEYEAVTGATHPNCREAQPLELKQGWQVLSGGKTSFIGLEKFAEYIKTKLS